MCNFTIRKVEVLAKDMTCKQIRARIVLQNEIFMAKS